MTGFTVQSAVNLSRPLAGTVSVAPPAVAAPRRPVLLVVDDDEPLREALRLIFEYQYEILLADSGSHALSLIGNGSVDVAIVDLRMPGMSGLEFLERSRSLDTDIQAVILSGQSTFEMARQAVRLKAFDFLPKPFDLHQLRQTIQQAARHRAWLRLERQREAAVRRNIAESETAVYERNLLLSLLSELVPPLAQVAHSARQMGDEMSKTAAPSGEQLHHWRRQVQELAAQSAVCSDLAARPVPNLSSRDSAGAPAAQVMENLGRLLRSHPSAKGHLLTIRPPSLPVALLAAESDLLRILIALGRNALEASPAPHRVGIEAWLVNEPVRLGVTERLQGRFVLRETFPNQAPLLAISIHDDGPGIASEILPALFQSPVSTKPERGGIGLGLSVARDLVAACGGALELSTTPGLGTTATLYVAARRLAGA